MKLNLAGWKYWRLDAAGVAVCVVLTLTAYLGGVSPLLSSYEKALGQQQDLAVQETQAAKLETALAGLTTRLDTARTALERSELRLKPMSNVNLHLAEISAVAVRSGLQIDDIHTGSVTAAAFYETIPIYLAGSGSYRSCTVFLSRLRAAFPDTSATSVDLTAHAADASGAGRFRITLLWHAAPSQVAGAGPAAQVPSTPVASRGSR